jgi:transposase
MGRQSKGLTLRPGEKQAIEGILDKGVHSSRNIKRAASLLKLSQGLSLQEVGQQTRFCVNTIRTLREKYIKEGLGPCLEEKPGRGRKPCISPLSRAKITALACSEPPKGHQRWTLRLLADKAVELEYVDHISHEKVRDVLKKTS